MRDEILSQELVNPIYSFHFKDYYEEYFSRKPEKRLEFLVTHEGTVIILYLIHEYSATRTEKKHFSYYGLPGIVVINSKVDKIIQDLAMRKVLSHLSGIGALKKLKDYSFDIIHPNPSSKNITSLETLISSGSSGYIYFERVIDISMEVDDIVNNLSKSVKLALKKTNLTAESFRFIDSNCLHKNQNEAINVLKDLHLQAAGRKTRSDKSWKIQESYLKNGCIVIGLGYFDQKPVHGSMFMLAANSAYYAVSANSREIHGTSVAHPFIFKAILALKELGIQKIFMGRQYEEFTRDVSEKELNIARFKSFFGGNLVFGIGLKNVK